MANGAITVTPEMLKQQARVYIQACDAIQQQVRAIESMNNQIAQER